MVDGVGWWMVVGWVVGSWVGGGVTVTGVWVVGSVCVLDEHQGEHCTDCGHYDERSSA